MKQVEAINLGHPAPLDRNRSILLSRDLLEMNDWVVVACKVSRLLNGRMIPGDASELVSIAVLGPGGRVLLDVLLRPDGAVNSDLLRIHGSDPAHTFKAPLFSEVHKVLKAGFARTRLLCYSPAKIMQVLERLCQQEKLPRLSGKFVDVEAEYSRFRGELGLKGQFKTIPLPQDADCAISGVVPLKECQHVLSLVHEMAASSQSSDSATNFNKNWSAAFYKPKMGPAEKLKELLGLGE